MQDMLITGGTIITMNPERQVIADGAVAIRGNRILDVGKTADLEPKYDTAEVINGDGMVVMPGLIDGHGHAGHGLVKTMGAEQSNLWYQACEQIYSVGSDEAFWYAESLLTALERLKSGTTCGLSFLGGGDSVMRTDDPAYGHQHCQATAEVGVREFVAVGPRRPPFPHRYARWSGNVREDRMVSFEDQLATCETLVQRWNTQPDGRVKLCMMMPTHHPEHRTLSATELDDLQARVRAVRQVTRDHGLLFTQDGHTRGTVRFAHETLGILGPDALLSHSTNLSAREIEICNETDTRIVHNPSAVASITARCPVPELLDAGVTVMLGSDGTAPDRSYDMFRHIFQCMRYHRTYYRDPNYMPPGKVLEMVTIDAARALGLEEDLGSIETGKKADIILVDMRKPHLYPANMPVHRVAYFANGSDVDTVIVDGQVLMRGRVVQTVDEHRVLDLAQKATEEMLDRNDLRSLLEIPQGFWRHSRFPGQGEA